MIITTLYIAMTSELCRKWPKIRLSHTFLYYERRITFLFFFLSNARSVAILPPKINEMEELDFMHDITHTTLLMNYPRLFLFQVSFDDVVIIVRYSTVYFIYSILSMNLESCEKNGSVGTSVVLVIQFGSYSHPLFLLTIYIFPW